MPVVLRNVGESGLPAARPDRRTVITDTVVRWRVPVLAILLLATMLRVSLLGTRPLWYDEAFAVLFAEKGVRAMLAGTLTPVAGAAADVHPIAYYTLLNGWMQLVGQSPLGVRLLSVYFGLLTVAAVYAIGRCLFGPRAGRVGMLLASISPFQVYYAQETRMYAGLGLACALTVLLYLRAVAADEAAEPARKRKSLWAWGGVAVAAAAALYMQNLAAVFLLTLGLSTLLRSRNFGKLALAGGVAFVLWLPWLLQLPGQFAKLQQGYWVSRPDLVTLVQTALIYHVGEEFLVQSGAGVRGQPSLALALFAAVLVPVLMLLQLARTRRGAARRGAAWLLVLGGGTPLLLFLASQIQPVYIQRVLLPAALMYAVALGWLLTTPSAPRSIRWGLAGLLAVVTAAGLWAHYTFDQFPRSDFPVVAHFLRERAVAGSAIVHSNKLSFLPTHYYDRQLPQSFLADPPASGSDTLALPTQQVLALYAAPEPAAAVGDVRRVWFVIYDRAVAEYESAGASEHPHLGWLAAHFDLAGSTHLNDLAIYEFTR